MSLLPSQEQHTLITLSCLQDIVGPRFHCAVCPSWDLCIQCEGIHMAGGDGSGHLSDHIMMKVCVSGVVGYIDEIADTNARFPFRFPHPR